MKKNSLISFLVLSSIISLGQSGAKWATDGNGIGAGDFIGTTNNFPLDFRTNNLPRMSLDANGNLKVNSFSGSGSRILLTDANGNVSALPAGSSGQFLSSNGTWSNLPLSASSWNVSGNDVFNSNSGNVGIGGTPNSLYKLDVFGDAHISNNLFVGGGIVITNQVDAALQIQTGDLIVNNDLNVTGNSKFVGTLTSNKGILFDATNNLGISFTPATGTTSSVFKFGNSTILAPLATCITPNINTGNPTYVFNGHISAVANSGLVNSVLNIVSAPWNGSGYIEVEGTDQSGGTNNGLFINYFCGRNTLINMGVGGKVSVGSNFEAGFANENLNITANINAVGGPNKITIGAFSQHNAPGGYNTKIVCNIDGTKAIGVVNGSSGVEGFKVYGNGKTVVGYDTQTSGPHLDAMLTVGGLSGKIVAKSCYIRILNWADDVFASDYKVPNPYEIEKFYLANKHLEGVPTEKEVLENGVELGEMNKILLRKVEEMTILMVNQQKEIDLLKERIKN